MKEKKLAIELLDIAIQRVNEAMDAIVNYAEEFGIEPKQDRVSMDEVVERVHKETGVPISCVKRVIKATLDVLTEVDNDDNC